MADETESIAFGTAMGWSKSRFVRNVEPEDPLHGE